MYKRCVILIGTILIEQTPNTLKIRLEPAALLTPTLTDLLSKHVICIVYRYGMLGSVDSNTGSPDMGWDTDQFPMDIRATTAVMQVTLYM